MWGLTNKNICLRVHAEHPRHQDYTDCQCHDLLKKASLIVAVTKRHLSGFLAEVNVLEMCTIQLALLLLHSSTKCQQLLWNSLPSLSQYVD